MYLFILGIVLGIGLTLAVRSVQRTVLLHRINAEQKLTQRVNTEARRIHETWLDNNVDIGKARPPAPAWYQVDAGYPRS